MDAIRPSPALERRLRGTVCVRCFARPAGSASLADSVPRDCEPRCQIFLNLPQIIRVALGTRGGNLGVYERACNELVCQDCQASPSHGDYCSERSTARCPLAVYLADVIEAIESMPRRELVVQP